jgi:hypothetical protein
MVCCWWFRLRWPVGWKQLQVPGFQVSGWKNLLPGLAFGYFPLLFIIVVDLNPVTIGVAKVELLHPIDAFGDSIFFTGPVFVLNPIFFEVGDEIVNGRYAEAKVGVFVVPGFGSGARNNMKVAMGAKAEPGMVAIVKRFGNGIEAYDMLVEMGACFKVGYIQGNVIKDWFVLSEGCH